MKSESEVAQSCPTLSDPMDCSLPGSSALGFSKQEYWSGLPLPSNSMQIINYPYLPGSRVHILFSNQDDYHIDSKKKRPASFLPLLFKVYLEYLTFYSPLILIECASLTQLRNLLLYEVLLSSFLGISFFVCLFFKPLV